MAQAANIRDGLLKKGFFPEVLPPCFDSSNMPRAFKGLIKPLAVKRFHKRSSAYIRYSGTKHDNNRRYYGTVNPIPYFYITQFIGKHWKIFTDKRDGSSFGVSTYNLGAEADDRALLIPAMSELSPIISSKIKHSPFIIKTDIAQFFPSIYTHSLAWVAHGVQASKEDTRWNSERNFFNGLDWFTQQCQNGQTRGVIVGPDAFRVMAEFIACEIDSKLSQQAGEFIVGAVRHVDDFYIGIRSELDSTIVLSHLREILQNFELQINDNKTKLLSGLYPLDDIWAQELRRIDLYRYDNLESFDYLLDKANDISQLTGSQSPMKIALRKLDKAECYLGFLWNKIEQKLQRILYHYPHCIDYIALLIAKRTAIEEDIDKPGWKSAIELILEKALGASHHHEILWLIWVAFVCKIEISPILMARVARSENSHVKALLIAGHQEGYCNVRTEIRLGESLSTNDENWLHNLVARTTGFSRARFSGPYATEFEHLVSNRIKLIDFKKHMESVAELHKEAISRTKYGYDSDDDEDEEDFYGLFDVND